MSFKMGRREYNDLWKKIVIIIIVIFQARWFINLYLPYLWIVSNADADKEIITLIYILVGGNKIFTITTTIICKARTFFKLGVSRYQTRVCIQHRHNNNIYYYIELCRVNIGVLNYINICLVSDVHICVRGR
jgi:hypothetical protein